MAWPTLAHGRRDGRHASAGFTLIEVLVAFVIAALALVALYRGAAVGLRTTVAAQRVEAARVVARSVLASVDGAVLVARTLEGHDVSGLNWRLQVSPLEALPLQQAPRDGQVGDGGAAGAQVTLYRISVVVTLPGTGQVLIRLVSARIGSSTASRS